MTNLANDVQQFLSTPSARRATRNRRNQRHANQHFYPRPPRGGRQQIQRNLGRRYNISIHALREEGDKRRYKRRRRTQRKISIHALREEGDLAVCFIMAM